MSTLKVRRPNASDNKYSRGVVSFITGSEVYPGAAILTVGGALAVGVGMVRFLGTAAVSSQVLQSYPEVVLKAGENDCLVVGSGHPEALTADQATALAQAPSAVIDAAALEYVQFDSTPVASLLTPHFGELRKLEARLGLPQSLSPADGDQAATRLASATNRFVLVKGSTTYLAGPNQQVRDFGPLSAWLATAGTGDVLAGILGALMAANRDLIENDPADVMQIAELAVRIHSRAADLALADGPVSAHTLLTKVGVATLEFLD
ncbi:MAG: hypothetical protein RL670_77 [Actinomycetota bacterium]